MVKDVEIREKVKQRATKWVKDLKNKSYVDRLKILNLTNLEKRRRLKCIILPMAKKILHDSFQ